jgi:hypothetical protein
LTRNAGQQHVLKKLASLSRVYISSSAPQSER